MDKGTLHGIAKYKEAHDVAEKLYKEGMLTGQKTNRPLPLPPDKEMFAGFTQLYWSKDNNPAAIELKVLEMGENDLPKLHVGLAHVNPGGWTYTEGWGPMNRAYVEVMDENTKIREMAALQARVAKMEGGRRAGLLDLNSKDDQISLGGLGGGMLLAGTLALAGWRRRERSER
jgi:hydroxylamine dehydrogenase